MSYMSAFEYQSKSGASISTLNKFRKYLMTGKKNIADQISIWKDIVVIFEKKKIEDVQILVSFNLRDGGDSQKSIIYQIYKTIKSIFEGNQKDLDSFISLVSSVIEKDREVLSSKESSFLIDKISDAIIAIDEEVIGFKQNEEKDNFLNARGF